MSFHKSSKSDLPNRILFVILALIIYRFGTYIPLPGVDSFALQKLTSDQAGGLLGMFNMFTGGAIGRLSIFALNIMPYITASIIMQLMSVLSKDVAAYKKEGESGRKKITQLTRYLTVLLALVQGYGIAVGIESMVADGHRVIQYPGLYFRITSTLSLMGGTVFVMWLGEQITVKGIGNGSSILIFSGIISGLPNAIATFFEMGRTGAISTVSLLFILVVIVSLILLILFMEKAQRRLQVQYPKRQVGNKIYGGESTRLPLKINTAGVIPPIFASSLLLFPTTLAGFYSDKSDSIIHSITQYLAHGKLLYILMYCFLICFFSFFYTSIIFNPDETAENLKKNGGIILGRRPGKQTSEYFDYILIRLTVLGAAYMSFVCILPEVLILNYSIPFYLGGTSLLIVVNVVMDLSSQVQTHMLSHQYQALMKKAKIRGIK